MKTIYYYPTPFGELGIVEEDDYIMELLFNKQDNLSLLNTPLKKETIKQLNEYFNGKRKQFSIPYKLSGTIFQQEVYQALLEIPYGECQTYQDIAIAIHHDKACRAVGNANNKNKLPIIVPCHRVIGQKNKLVGYALGLDMKQKLLEMEESHK